MRTIRGLSVLLPLALAAACSDSNGLGDATEVNAVDTVTLGALEGTPISTPSGFRSIATASRCGPTRLVDFEFAYNIRRLDDGPSSGSSCPSPPSGCLAPTSPIPACSGARRASTTSPRAPSNGYVTDSAVPIHAGRAIPGPLARGLQHRRAALRQARRSSASRTARSPSRCWPTRTAGSRTCSPACRKTERVIDLKRLRQDPEASRASLLRRRDPAVGPLLDAILELDRQRRELLVQAETSQGRAERRERGGGASEARQGAGRRPHGPPQDQRRRGQGARRPAPRPRGRARPARARGAQFPGR